MQLHNLPKLGESSSLVSELEPLLPHSGPIFNNDNAVVYVKIEEASRVKSVESTIKSFSRHKDGRSAFQYLISDDASEFKD